MSMHTPISERTLRLSNDIILMHSSTIDSTSFCENIPIDERMDCVCFLYFFIVPFNVFTATGCGDPLSTDNSAR